MNIKNQVNNMRKIEEEKSAKMVKLLENELFEEIIIKDFINSGIIANTVEGNMDSSATIDELKARQILHKYIFNALTAY